METSNSNILVLGASGQLGQCISKIAGSRKIQNILLPGKETANVLRPDLLKDLFESFRPAYVVNCAAYTAVDKAEDDVELCRMVNKDGPTNIARLCKEFNATLIHVSTDFVFEGSHVSLLKETDVAKPVNVYGLTKLEGELEIMDILSNYIILRTSWLYSEY